MFCQLTGGGGYLWSLVPSLTFGPRSFPFGKPLMRPVALDRTGGISQIGQGSIPLADLFGLVHCILCYINVSHHH